MHHPFRLLAALLLGISSLLPTGCDNAKPPAPEAAAATPTPSPALEDEEPELAEDDTPEAKPVDTGEPPVLNLLCWTEYVPQRVIDAFEKQTGIKVNVTTCESNEEMLEMLSSSDEYDLIQPSEYLVDALVKAGQLAPITHENIPNLKNIAPEFLDRPFDPGNQYSVPWMAGTVGIVVNTDLVQDTISGYSDVFQEKFKDRIVVVNDSREIVSWALASLGIPMNDITEENLAKTRPVLARWLPLVRYYDSDRPSQRLLDGDASLGIVWSGEAALLLRAGRKFRWILPSEGTHLFIDNLAIPAKAKHPRNAELFMNFVLRPKISKMISDEFPYLNPNLAARELLSEADRKNPASFPPEEEISKMPVLEDIGDLTPAVEDLVTTMKIQ